LVRAAEGLDERGLAAAILAEESVDLACPKLKRDVVVGDDAGKGLANVT
jgi:hypothetical protein